MLRSPPGNLKATLGMLALVWTLAAFGEELAYRGYVLERAAALGDGSRTAHSSTWGWCRSCGDETGRC